MSDGFGQGGRNAPHNLIFAGIFVAVSAAMGYHAYSTMNLGTLDDMGPGFFPLMLSIVLAILAVGVAFTALPADRPPLQLAKLRSIVLVIGSPLIFAATVRSLGLAPSLFLTIFAVSFASRFATLKQSLALAIGFTVFCVVLFIYLLGLPIPLRGSLLTF
jgi:hypothetical protein